MLLLLPKLIRKEKVIFRICILSVDIHCIDFNVNDELEMLNAII